MARSQMNAVFLADVGEWRPTHIHTMPPAIFGGEFYGRKMPLKRALCVAQEYNAAHLPCNGKFEGRWAIVVKGLKAKHHFIVPQNAEKDGAQ